MTNKLTIWNMALGFVGTRTIAGEDERTMESIQCSLFWDNARRQTLRDAPWNFAQRRIWLAEVPIPKGYEHDATHAYALPEKCLRVHAIREAGERRESAFEIVFDQDYDRGILLTDAIKALCAYTEDIDNPLLFDDQFTHLLARKLACLIAVPLLKNNTQKIQELETLYQQALHPAQQSNAAERTFIQKEDSWISCR